MFFWLYGSSNNIEDLLGGLLAVWDDCACLIEGLKGLLIFVHEHLFKLFPALVGGVFFLSIYV